MKQAGTPKKRRFLYNAKRPNQTLLPSLMALEVACLWAELALRYFLRPVVAPMFLFLAGRFPFRPTT